MSEREQADALFKAVHADDLLLSILERQDHILDKLSQIETDLAGHMGREEAMMKGLCEAFPKKSDGAPDYEGHRDYHATLIEESRARTEMWKELKMELMRKGIWGLIGVLAFLVLYWWNREVKHVH